MKRVDLTDIPKNFLSTQRVETLNDGVFAIVMTLLVLDLRMPEIAAADLLPHLIQEWPMFLSYAASFVLLGVFWVGHVTQYSSIRYADRILLWINIAMLLFASLIPFTTSLMGRYADQEITVLLYGLNLIILGLISYWHWCYATHHHRLVDHNIDDRFILLAKRRILFSPLVCLLAILISFVSIKLSLFLYIIIPPFFILPGKIDQFWHRPAVPHNHE